MTQHPYPVALNPGDPVVIRAEVVAVHPTTLGHQSVVVHVPGPHGTVTRLTLWAEQLEPVLTEDTAQQAHIGAGGPTVDT